MNGHSAWALVLVSLGAAFLPGLGKQLRIPSVALEIIFGVFIGKSLLNVEMGGDWIAFLSHLGFLILMFNAGMEINFQMLGKQKASMFGVQAGVFLATMALSMGAALLLGQGIYLGLVLSTTSLGLVVPTLHESKAGQTLLGQNVMVAATLADFLTLLFITFFLLWHENGMSWALLRPLPLFIGFALLLKLVQFAAWWFPEKTGRLLALKDSQELGVRVSLALMFLFVALSELAHLEPVLGAFLGGALLSIVFKKKTELEVKLSSVGYGFLVPFFFIHVGMQFDLPNILSGDQLLFTAELFGFAMLVKLLPSLGFMAAGLSFSQALNVGLLLTARLSLIIVAATIGLEFGFITAAFKDSIILLAVITCLLGPVLFKVFYRSEHDETSGPKMERRKLTVGWMRHWK